MKVLSNTSAAGLFLGLTAALSSFDSFSPSKPRSFATSMSTHLEQNKAVVRRFNHEVIEQGNTASFHELMDPAFVNHAAPAGADNGPAGMLHTFNQVLRPAMPDLKVTIYDQVAEVDLVTTRKAITGTQTGPLLGIAPTGRTITIDVIDVVRLRLGKYYEHWGVNTLPAVLQQLAKP